MCIHSLAKDLCYSMVLLCRFLLMINYVRSVSQANQKEIGWNYIQCITESTDRLVIILKLINALIE